MTQYMIYSIYTQYIYITDSRLTKEYYRTKEYLNKHPIINSKGTDNV